MPKPKKTRIVKVGAPKKEAAIKAIQNDTPLGSLPLEECPRQELNRRFALSAKLVEQRRTLVEEQVKTLGEPVQMALEHHREISTTLWTAHLVDLYPAAPVGRRRTIININADDYSPENVAKLHDYIEKETLTVKALEVTPGTVRVCCE